MGQKVFAYGIFIVLSLLLISCGGKQNQDAFWQLSDLGQVKLTSSQPKKRVIVAILPAYNSRVLGNTQSMPFWNFLEEDFVAVPVNAVSDMRVIFRRESLDRMRDANWSLFGESGEDDAQSLAVAKTISNNLDLKTPFASAPNIIPFNQFDTDLTHNQLPPLALIIPGIIQNWQFCPGSSNCSVEEQEEAVDDFLRNNFAKLVLDPSFLSDNFLLITSGTSTIIVSDETKKRVSSTAGIEDLPVSGALINISSQRIMDTGADSTDDLQSSLHLRLPRSNPNGNSYDARLGISTSPQSIPSQNVDWAAPGPIGATIPNVAIFTNTTVKSLNKIRFADQYSGADFCEKVNAAAANLPLAGGTIDAHGLEGAQTCLTNPFHGIKSPFTLVLPAGTITTSVTWSPNSRVDIECLSAARQQQHDTSNPCRLLKSPSLNGAVIEILSVNDADGSTIRGLTVDSSQGASGDGIHVDAMHIKIVDTTVENQANDGIVWGKGDGPSTHNNAEYGMLESVNSSYNGRFGIYIKGDQIKLSDLPNATGIYNSQFASNASDGIRLDDSTNVNIYNSTAEANKRIGLHIMGNAARWLVIGGDYNESNIAGNCRIENGNFTSIFGGSFLQADCSNVAPFVTDMSTGEPTFFVHHGNVWSGITGNTGPRGRYEFGVVNAIPVPLSVSPDSGNVNGHQFVISDGGATGMLFGVNGTVPYIQARTLDSSHTSRSLQLNPLGGQILLGANAIVDSDGNGTFLGGINVGGKGGISNAGPIIGATTINASGTATLGGISTGGSPLPNHTVCWKTSTTLGYCSSQPDATGACSCK